MLLTLSTTHAAATNLGYLLHKHPDKLQTFELSFGKAHVFYPTSTPEGCTAALLLDVDPVALVRGRKGSPGYFALQLYVSDRPYAASSFLSVAIARVFGSALAGRSKGRQELADLTHGSGPITTACSAAKTAAFAPMPRASVVTTSAL